MKKGVFSLKTSLAACVLAAVASHAASAADPVQQHNSSAVWFENWIGLSNASVTVAAPDGSVTTIESASGTPVYYLDRSTAMDGVYRFELRAATEEQAKIVNPIDQGRGDAQRTSTAVPFYLKEYFVVERGVIITPKDIQENEG